jgi:hypothetical protein
MDFWGTDTSAGYGVLSADQAGAGASAFSFDIPYVTDPGAGQAGYGVLNADVPSIFPTPSFSTDGAGLIDTRSNTSWNLFDQSKISASFANVIGSVTEAGAKTGLQIAQSSINKGTQQPGWTGNLFRNFQSTKTGAQINAGAYGVQLQQLLYNPLVWFAVIGLIVLWLFMRK